MHLTSINFIILFIIILLIHYLIPVKMRNRWLLLVSYIFIGLWSWQSAAVIFFVTISHYYFGIWLAKNRHKTLLAFGISINVFLLFFFRSANFFIPGFFSLLADLGINSKSGALEFLLPVGLSFYVLQNVSYLVDVYRAQMQPSSNFIDFSLYLVYFPKILAGPIERARTFLPKLEADRPIGEDDIVKNIILIIGGMVRKLVIADSLAAAIPTTIFENPGYYSAYDLIGWLIVYAFVIYNDFAGYTSVARGISGLLGIELSKNFDFPYFARNFSEFWNRWHITLSHWLRDYIYFPLSRTLLRKFPNRRIIINIIIPPLVTMLVSGIWHGLSLHMIFWGALHGVYLFLERLGTVGEPIIPPDQQPHWRQILSMGIVFILVVLAWVPFVMDTPIAVQYWKGMLNIMNFSLDSKSILLILPYIGLLTIIDWILNQNRDYRYKIPHWVQASIIAAALFLILIASSTGTEIPFIYQGF